MLENTQITTLHLWSDGLFFLDYITLEKFAVPKVSVPGLKAFDVGRSGTPGFRGFGLLTEKDEYCPDKGYGWKNPVFSRMDDRIHPDDLFRNNLSCLNARLAVDLPDNSCLSVLSNGESRLRRF